MISCGRKTSYCLEPEPKTKPKRRPSVKPKTEIVLSDDDEDYVTPAEKPIKKEKPATEKKPRKKKGWLTKKYQAVLFLLGLMYV